MAIVCLLLQLYLIALFGRIILSWFPISPGSPLAPVFSALYAVTEPVLGPIRRMLPPMRMGGMGLDLSPIIVIVLFQVIQRSICG
ncbi:MAG: YggT family protein [Acidimicrobiaceae bacterium]|nr:YggT family protein [Acidimicrobiaceae bacterium]